MALILHRSIAAPADPSLGTPPVAKNN